MKSLGIDIGSSSVKVSLMDIETGACVASATQPAQEMPIEARHSGWAEQDPDLWWYYVGVGLDALREAGHPLDDVRAVGITYQMHGLVCVDCTGHPLRKAIIWCDSRAVEIGAEALGTLGRERCLEHLLNSPGNFTASKLAWVRRNEPELFARIDKVMLPGDYIAFRLSGDISTTVGGLSEQILWDFDAKTRRNSTDLEDIFIAHISAMDVMARAAHRRRHPRQLALREDAPGALRLLRFGRRQALRGGPPDARAGCRVRPHA